MFPFFFLNHWKIKLQESNLMKAFYHFYQFSESFLQNTALSDPVSIRHICPISTFTIAIIGQIFKLITAFRLSLSFKLCKYFPFKACPYFPEKKA